MIHRTLLPCARNVMKVKDTCLTAQKRNYELSRKVLFEATHECHSPHKENVAVCCI